MSRRPPLFRDADPGGWSGRKRRGADGELDITPMIDVTFLLLIFFMVTSTMQASPDYDVPPARYGTGVESRSAIVLLVKKPEAAGSDLPRVLLEHGDHRQQAISLEQLRSLVATRVADGSRKVIVKAERDVPHGLVQQVTKTIVSVEGAEFAIGVRDEPAQY